MKNNNKVECGKEENKQIANLQIFSSCFLQNAGFDFETSKEYSLNCEMPKKSPIFLKI